MLASMPQSLAHFLALGVPGIQLEADGRAFHNAGASEAQELGAMMAYALTYLRMFEDARQPVLYAAAHIGFSVSVDQNHSRSVAKVRALRELWARVLERYSVPPIDPVIHAETSYRMLTSRALETNIARATIAAGAAIEAGVTTLSMLPPPLPIGLPDHKSRRAARDTLLVLGHEAELPRGGEHAGGMDALSARMAEEAWEELSRIEEEGGVLRSIQAGRIQARITESRNALAARLREGAQPIVGTTLHAAARRSRPMAPPASGAGPLDDGVVFCDRLPTVRLEELVEQPG
jgi:methylmalonyl-CoA mutase